MKSVILLATVCLEPNRWTREKNPTIRPSEWAPRAKEAGFDGLEIWEYHVTKRGAEESEALRATGFPAPVWNSYAGFSDGEGPSREASLRGAKAHGATRLKWNFGNEAGLLESYLRNLKAFHQAAGDGLRLLCECHPNTLLEEPEKAGEILARCDFPVDAIVHPFNEENPSLERMFRHLGPRISHAHVQTRHEVDLAKLLSIRSKKTFVRDTLKKMFDLGFRGSFTIEFVEGTRTADDVPEKLFAAAKDDLSFLREEVDRLS